MKKLIGMMVLSLAALTMFGAEMSKSVPKGWIEDFESAKKQAAQEKKQIVMAFSGSDWCPWCVKMERDVYSKPEFIAGATNRFVLVMIDCPSDQSILSKLAAAQNRKLAREYGIRGFPSTLVVDAAGKEVKRFSGYRPTPKAALEEIK